MKLPGNNWRKILITLVVFIALVFAGLIVYRQITGKSLGLKSFVFEQIRRVTSLGRAAANSSRVKSYNQGDFTNVIFVHHSVGDALIEQGNVRPLMTAAGLKFWDHDYNAYGISDPEGIPVNYSYNIPDDNTEPDGYVTIFSQPFYNWPVNAFSGMLQHEVIIIKSCFTASDINSDEKLVQYQTDYQKISEVASQHPEKIFVMLTPPPLNPASTTPEIATRARKFAEWLGSTEFTSRAPNVFVFDFYSLLAEPDATAPDANMLRQSYRNGDDSHPNSLANETIGPLLVDFVSQAVTQYRLLYAP